MLPESEHDIAHCVRVIAGQDLLLVALTVGVWVVCVRTGVQAAVEALVLRVAQTAEHAEGVPRLRQVWSVPVREVGQVAVHLRQRRQGVHVQTLSMAGAARAVLGGARAGEAVTGRAREAQVASTLPGAAVAEACIGALRVGAHVRHLVALGEAEPRQACRTARCVYRCGSGCKYKARQPNRKICHSKQT